MNLFSFFWIFIHKHRLIYFFIFIVSFVWALDATLWPYILRKIIDIFTQFETNRTAAWPSLKLPVIWGISLWLVIEYGFRLQGFLMVRAIPKLEADIRMAMFDHIQHHSPKYFNEHFAGSLSNKITDMTTQATLLIQQLLTLFIPAVAGCTLAIIFFIKINSLFAIVLAAWIVLHFSACFAFARKIGTLEILHGEKRSSLIGKIVDSLTNNFAVNLFYRFVHERAQIASLQKEEQQTHVATRKYIEKMRFALGILSLILGGLCVNGLILYFWLHGKISTGEAIQVFNTAWNILLILWLAALAIPGVFQSIGIATQALSLMNDPQDIHDIHNAKPLSISSGEIRFENVTFHYGKKQLFQNKNVYIRSGEKVGLVGYSGAGKSTFVNLILRLYPVETGKITIDGQDISKITLESLRNQLALIPQDPLLFHRSLKENIQYGKLDASDEEIWEAAKLAHSDEFIRKIPKGYQAFVGERGTKLSGGERQRIAIARAILKNAPIVIFDEATSALDSVTEKYIQDSLEKLMEKRMTIVIAHRLSTLARMDRILVFDQGKIVEQGSHEQLLALNGHYARMWKTQAGGFLPEKPS